MTARQLIGVSAATVGLAVFFVLFAWVDLEVTGWFWTPTEGFYLAATWWARLMYEIVPPIAYGLVGGSVLLLIVNAVRRRPTGPFGSRALIYLIAVLAIGPGLVVNVVFKDHWGRARPRDVAEFGGAKQFTPAFVISDQCDRNCSFVAGHPSMAFALAALALILARRRRDVLFGMGLAFALGLLVGFGRIVQGGHFLSDVVFSGIFTVGIAVGLYRLFSLHQTTEPDSTG